MPAIDVVGAYRGSMRTYQTEENFAVERCAERFPMMNLCFIYCMSIDLAAHPIEGQFNYGSCSSKLVFCSCCVFCSSFQAESDYIMAVWAVQVWERNAWAFASSYELCMVWYICDFILFMHEMQIWNWRLAITCNNSASVRQNIAMQGSEILGDRKLPTFLMNDLLITGHKLRDPQKWAMYVCYEN